MAMDFIDYRNRKIVRNCKSVIVNSGSYTFDDVKENSPYLCSHQSQGVFNGKNIVIQDGINNAELIYQLATPTEETIDVPEIYTHDGTSIVEVATEIKPSWFELQNWRQVMPNEVESNEVIGRDGSTLIILSTDEVISKSGTTLTIGG